MSTLKEYLLRPYQGSDKQGNCYWTRVEGIDGGCVFNDHKQLLGIAQICTANASMRPATGSEMEIFTTASANLHFPGEVSCQAPPPLPFFSAVDTLSLLRKYTGEPCIEKVNINHLLAKVRCIEDMEEIRAILAKYGATFTKEHFCHVNAAFLWYMVAQDVPYDFELLLALFSRADLHKGSVPYFCTWLLQRLQLTPSQTLQAFCALSRVMPQPSKDIRYDCLGRNLHALLNKIFEKEEDYSEEERKNFLCCAVKCSAIPLGTLLDLLEKYSWSLSLPCLFKLVKHGEAKEILRLCQTYPEYLVDIMLCVVRNERAIASFKIIEMFPLVKNDTTLVTRIFLEIDSEDVDTKYILKYLYKQGARVDAKLLQKIRIDADEEKQKLIDMFLREDV